MDPRVVQYRVLGPVEVLEGTRTPGLGGYRQRLVLAVLLSRPNQVLTADWLVDAVWGAHPPATARKTLQAYLARLRAVLPPGAIQSTPAGYRLATGPEQLDSLQFAHLADRGHAAVASEPAVASRLLREALALWRGPAFGDLGDQPALALEAERLRERRLSVLADRAHADLAAGRVAGLVGELSGLVEEYPTDERFRAALMHAQYLTGRQTEALRGYEQYRRTLDDELGAAPSPPLTRLHEAILRQEPALGTPSPLPDEQPAERVRNPYKGLRPFDTTDAGDFFGRDTLVDALDERLSQQRFVAVVGPSGSGKSSLVLAGLVPRLRRQGWLVLTMVPGRAPFDALLAGLRGISDVPLDLLGDSLDLVRAAATVLPDGDERLLVAVDQLEEVFHEADGRVRDRFLTALVEALDDPSSRVSVVVTVRADAVGRLLASPPLGLRVPDHLVAVPGMDASGLEAAAVGPAEQLGVTVEPRLLAQLVADMTDQPGALPQFQYALTEMFDHRDGSELTMRAYRSLGGVHGVIARRAEQVFQSLGTEQRDLARQVFLRLVDVGAQHEVVRRRVARSTLEALPSDPVVQGTVLDAFDSARLLTFDRDPATGEPTVELAHEALIVAWPRLAEWATQARDDLRWRRLLATDLAEWESSGRADDHLLGGARLAQLEGWRQSSTVDLTEPERDFLDASEAGRRRDADADAARAARELEVQRRATRRLRWLVAVVTTAAVVATGLGVYAARRGAQAEASARDAHVRELATASTLTLATDPELSVLLALEAVEQSASAAAVSPVAVTALHAAVAADRVLATTTGGLAVEFTHADTLAVGGLTPRVISASGETLTRLPASRSPVVEMADAPGSSTVAVATQEGEVSLVETTTGRIVRQLVDPRFGRTSDRTPVALDLSPDGRLLASAVDALAGLVVWDAATGRVVARPLNLDPGPALAFRPDGRAVAVGTGATIEVRAIPSGRLLQRLPDQGAEVTAVAYSVSGTRLVTASTDGTLRVWDAERGRLLAVAQAPGAITAVGVDDPPVTIVTGTESGEVTVWRLTEGELEGRLLTQLPTDVLDVALQRGGLVAAAGTDVVVVVDARDQGRYEVARWPATNPPVDSTDYGRSAAPKPLAVSPDGTLRATVELDGSTVRVVGPHRETRLEHDPPPAHADDPAPETVTGMAFDPARPLLALTRISDDGQRHSLETRDLASGDVVARSETYLGVSPFFAGGLAYDPTGRWLAASQCLDYGSPALMLDPSTLRILPAPFPGILVQCAHHLSIDAQGRRLAVASESVDTANVVVVDTSAGTAVARMSHPDGVSDLALAPDGQRLLTVGRDGTARIWDVDTGGERHVLRGHRGLVTTAVWSADGDTVLTSGVDRTVRAWDPGSGRAGVVLAGLAGYADLALTPDGSQLISVAGDEAQVWAWDVDDLVDIATTRVSRTLTEAECEQYAIERCAAG